MDRALSSVLARVSTASTTRVQQSPPVLTPLLFLMLRTKLVATARRAAASSTRSLASCTCRPSLTAPGPTRTSAFLSLRAATPSARAYASAATAAAPVAEAEAVAEPLADGVKPPPPPPLPPVFACTPADSARLTRLRNVGISAHIDVSPRRSSLDRHPRRPGALNRTFSSTHSPARRR